MPDSLPNAITEPLKVIAPIAAPRNSSSRLPRGIGSPLAARCRRPPGSATAAMAMNTAARPIMLWKNATSSGIFVISTRLGAPRAVAAAGHQAEQHPAEAEAPARRRRATISAAVVNAAIAMPTMPKRLPRIEVVGCAQALERLDEADAGDEVQQRDEVRWLMVCVPFELRDAFAQPGCFVLLPEHLEHAARDEEAAEDVDRGERHRQHAHPLAKPPSVSAAASMAPTMTIAEIALVTAISGVCSAGVTVHTTW